MKKIVEIVIIPSPSCATWIWKDGEDMFYTGKDMPNSNRLYHQLLVLSDDKPKKGDVILANGIVCDLLHNGETPQDEDDPVKIIASQPQIEGTLSISQEFIQQYVQSQGKGVVYMETEEKDIDQYLDNDCSFGYTIEISKIDKAGNAILSIEQEVNIQPLEGSTEIVNNEAIEFADWLLVNYVNTINNQWRKLSSYTTYTSKELYNIWQQTKKQ